MRFTNVSETGLYLRCCHREVEPGGTFYVPWLLAEHDRALRSAMTDGALAWTSEAGEPSVPGSPDPAWIAKRQAARREAAARRVRDEAVAVARQEAEQTAALKANMARMGHFAVPKITQNEKVRAVAAEKPVTAADVISGDSGPRSLDAIRRHNKAVRTLGRKA